jgi:hypothetical protein
MAIHSLLQVLNHSKAKKSHRLVLIEIANHTNKAGLAWPSYQRLANRTGLSKRWVIQIIQDLEAVGELLVIPNGAPNGGQALYITCGAVDTAGELTSPRMKSSGELSSKKVVNSLHTESVYDESIDSKNCTSESTDEPEETWFTPDEAVRLGLTRGSRMYRKATGELLPEE